MLILPNPVEEALAGHRAHVLSRLWRISRRDGTQFRFTDADVQVQFDDGTGPQTFSPAGGWDASAQRREAGLDEQDRATRGAVSSSAITAEDLGAGLFAEAEVVEYEIDPRWPWAGAYSTFRYWIADVERTGEIWEVEIMGATAWLATKTGRTCGRDCDADVFDARCGISNTDETWFEVTGVRVLAGSQDADEPRRVFAAVFSDIPSSGPEEDEYKHGRLTWTSGANAGVVSEVKEYAHTATPSQRDIELCLPTPYDIADADEFTIQSGCDRLRSTCVRKFDNLVNHRGFPFMPGADDALSTPDIFYS